MTPFAKLYGPDDNQLLVTLEEDWSYDYHRAPKPVIRYTRPAPRGHGTQSYVFECRDWNHAELVFATIDIHKAQQAFKMLEERASEFDLLDELPPAGR